MVRFECFTKEYIIYFPHRSNFGFEIFSPFLRIAPIEFYIEEGLYLASINPISYHVILDTTGKLGLH